jgi:hypothetical protein
MSGGWATSLLSGRRALHDLSRHFWFKHAETCYAYSPVPIRQVLIAEYYDFTRPFVQPVQIASNFLRLWKSFATPRSTSSNIPRYELITISATANQKDT